MSSTQAKVTRVIKHLLENYYDEDMVTDVFTMLNVLDTDVAEEALCVLNDLAAGVQDTINYRIDMDAQNDIHMRFTTPESSAIGSPDNDIMAAMQSFKHDL